MSTSLSARVRVESRVFALESESESLRVESESSLESLATSPSRVSSLIKKKKGVCVGGSSSLAEIQLCNTAHVTTSTLELALRRDARRLLLGS